MGAQGYAGAGGRRMLQPGVPQGRGQWARRLLLRRIAFLPYNPKPWNMSDEQVTPQAWERVALEALEALGLPTHPIDIEHVAAALGLQVMPIDSAALVIVGRTVLISPSLPPARRQELLARAVARWLTGSRGMSPSEACVAMVGAAIVSRCPVSAVAASPRPSLAVLPGGNHGSRPSVPRPARATGPLLRLCR